MKQNVLQTINTNGGREAGIYINDDDGDLGHRVFVGHGLWVHLYPFHGLAQGGDHAGLGPFLDRADCSPFLSRVKQPEHHGQFLSDLYRGLDRGCKFI